MVPEEQFQGGSRDVFSWALQEGRREVEPGARFSEATLPFCPCGCAHRTTWGGRTPVLPSAGCSKLLHTHLARFSSPHPKTGACYS